MAEPLVILFFQRGQFSSADAVTTALIIRAMVLGFLLTRFVNVTQQLFYANSDVQTPFVSTVIYTIANIVFAVVLSRWLEEIGIGLAVSIASVCNLVSMMWKLNGRFGPVPWSEMRSFSLRLLGTTVLTGVAFVAGSRFLPIVSGSEPLTRILAVAMPSVIGVGFFVTGVVAFRWFDGGLIRSAGAGATS